VRNVATITTHAKSVVEVVVAATNALGAAAAAASFGSMSCTHHDRARERTH
jgi:hypothetical protein